MFVPQKNQKSSNAAISILNAFGIRAIPISSAIIPVSSAAVFLLSCLGRLTYIQCILFLL